jgi:hypothetical protein
MLHPDAWPARRRDRQRAANGHSAAGAIVIEEGDTNGTW